MIVSSDYHESVQVDHSPATCANIPIRLPVHCGRLYLVAFAIAGEKAVARRDVVTDAYPGIHVLRFMRNSLSYFH